MFFLDDPFFSTPSYPFKEAKANPLFYLEATKYGGHVGFGSQLNITKNTWCEHRVLKFLIQQK